MCTPQSRTFFKGHMLTCVVKTAWESHVTITPAALATTGHATWLHRLEKGRGEGGGSSDQKGNCGCRERNGQGGTLHWGPHWQDLVVSQVIEIKGTSQALRVPAVGRHTEKQPVSAARKVGTEGWDIQEGAQPT